MIKLFSLGAAIVMLFTSYLPASESEQEKLIMQIVVDNLQNGHYTTKLIDDKFSNDVFEIYIKTLDGNKNFLLQSDVDDLAAYKNKLDEEILLQQYNFMEKSMKLIQKRQKETHGYIEDIMAQPFDFTKSEELETDPPKVIRPSSKKEMTERWRKILKYRAMLRIHTKMETQEKALEDNDTSIKQLPFDSLEVQARRGVKKTMDQWFTNMDRMEREDYISIYINSIVMVYDPHTNYFPPKDKEDFDIGMTGRLEGIGATLQEKDGYINVTRIVPGSASWKQGDLEVNDKILKVGQAAEEAVDVVGMRLDHAVKLIRGKKGTEVRLTVKKIDGSIQVIQIIRDVVILEATYAKAVTLQNGEGSHKYGYIHLPKFYSSFGGKGRDCADDVELALESLKERGINGVILDLRGNGGGSLQDVVEMAGLFIDQGPIVQIKARDGMPHVLRDRAAGTTYDGPLVVLVNSFSASASEIMAAAMQDYGRGVIIGSETFGKGTVQRFVNLDVFLSPQQQDSKPLGQLKITIQKFYRIDGRTTQLKGVQPDIILPDRYKYIEVGEKEQDHAITWDEIPASSYNKWMQGPKDLTTICENSLGRVKDIKAFGLIDENAVMLKAQRDHSMASLNLDVYSKEMDERKSAKDKIRDEKEKEVEEFLGGLVIEDVITNMKKEAENDTIAQTRLKNFREGIQKDIYIYEAMSVLSDMEVQ